MYNSSITTARFSKNMNFSQFAYCVRLKVNMLKGLEKLVLYCCSMYMYDSIYNAHLLTYVYFRKFLVMDSENLLNLLNRIKRRKLTN